MMDRSGLKALAAKNQREVTLMGATFLIRKISFQEALKALGEMGQNAIISYFFNSQSDMEEVRAQAKQRLATDPDLQKVMIHFRDNVLRLGMVDPVLCGPGEEEDLEPQEGPAKISGATLEMVANDLQGEILGGEEGKAEGES